MSTPRKPSREILSILEEADAIAFEGHVVREWCSQLLARSMRTKDRLGKQKARKEQCAEAIDELQDTIKNLQRAEAALKFFDAAVKKRGHE